MRLIFMGAVVTTPQLWGCPGDWAVNCPASTCMLASNVSRLFDVISTIEDFVQP